MAGNGARSGPGGACIPSELGRHPAGFQRVTWVTLVFPGSAPFRGFRRAKSSNILTHQSPSPDSEPRREAAELPILKVRDLGVRFGGMGALDDVYFDIESRQIVGLIGPNGAGKTTLFNCLSRLYQPSGGSIAFEDRDLLKAKPHDIARLGIGRTFQNLALFGT